MREYIDQFYNEGFATTFYLKPINYLKNKLKNKILLQIISLIIKFLYTVLVIMFALYMFVRKFPL